MKWLVLGLVVFLRENKYCKVNKFYCRIEEEKSIGVSEYKK